jgi:hypothetical protein
LQTLADKVNGERSRQGSAVERGAQTASRAALPPSQYGNP